MTMEQLCRMLKPIANIYVIILSWSLTIFNLYLFRKPLEEHATSAGLNTIPTVLDLMNYYTPDEGYQVLSALGDSGRNAYRIANRRDFILPILLFLSLSLPNVAVGKGCRYVAVPFIYMVSDYIENIAEKYVLEIFPERNDVIIALACYVGLIKIVAFIGSFLTLMTTGFLWVLKSTKSKKN